MRRTPRLPSLVFALALTAVLGAASACSGDDEGGSSADSGADARLREVGDLAADLSAGDDADAAGASDTATTDLPAPDGGADLDPADVAAGPSPESPAVGCQTNADCPDDGADPGVCCTNPNTYISECATESRCSGGARDACLTDAQCAARRPGEWTVCCHDRGDRNYCAPLSETCQPLRPCEDAADCSGDAVDTCCSRHPYYQTGYCTSEFFAASPATDCPQ